jgi:multicomponent Na+:H+ antiporter subunit G
VTGELLTLIGALLVLLAAVGVMRFDDVLARMHALAKASTLGVVLLLFGAAISLHDVNDVTSLLLAAVLQVLASPPASNLLSRATYLAGNVPSRLDVIDERARDRDEGDAPRGPGMDDS